MVTRVTNSSDLSPYHFPAPSFEHEDAGRRTQVLNDQEPVTALPVWIWVLELWHSVAAVPYLDEDYGAVRLQPQPDWGRSGYPLPLVSAAGQSSRCLDTIGDQLADDQLYRRDERAAAPFAHDQPRVQASRRDGTGQSCQFKIAPQRPRIRACGSRRADDIGPAAHLATFCRLASSLRT